MSEYVQVWRAKVAEGDVGQLLAVRAEAVAEAKRLCPALLRADLVQAGDGSWLDVLIPYGRSVVKRLSESNWCSWP
ncbi:MAG TPA: hypothetical protein VHN18_03340 [Micromonosporaceae bacterium]|nr:hypothetical protein [Micromonosporaceae bacterium]